MASLVFTVHAQTMLLERKLQLTWIEAVVERPEWTEVDLSNVGATRAFGTIAEAGGKVLRVVYTEDGDQRRVITTFFDRNAKKPG